MHLFLISSPVICKVVSSSHTTIASVAGTSSLQLWRDTSQGTLLPWGIPLWLLNESMTKGGDHGGAGDHNLVLQIFRNSNIPSNCNY